MAQRIVALLEVIHPDHEDRQRPVAAMPSPDLALERVPERAAVGQSGQAVSEGETLELIVPLGPQNGKARQGGKCLQELAAIGRERVLGWALDVQHADDPMIHDERERGVGPGDRRQSDVVGILRNVGRVVGVPVAGHPPDDTALPDRKPHSWYFRPEALLGHDIQFVRPAVEEKHRAHRIAEHIPDLTQNLVEDSGQIEWLQEALDQVHQRGHRTPCAARIREPVGDGDGGGRRFSRVYGRVC